MSAAIRILAIAPNSKGFGLAVIDGDGQPVDWRVREFHEPPKRKNARTVFEANKLIEECRPNALVLEDPHAPGSRKRKRSIALFALLSELATDSDIGVAVYGPRDLRATFGISARANKDQLAAAVAKRTPLLTRRLPKRRQLWESEKYAMSMFTAFALALTHLSRAQRRVRGGP